MAQAPVEMSKTSSVPTPADPWAAFRKEMDQLFDRFGAGFGFPMLRRMVESVPPWQAAATRFEMAGPAVDVTEDEAAFRIVAELPGMSEKDVELTMAGGMLVLKGEKRQEREEKQADYRLTERSFGRFERSFSLPDSVDPDRIGAEFAKGVLVVTLPKKPGTEPRMKKIEVRPAG